MSSLLSVCRLYFQYVVFTFSMSSLLSVCRLYFQYVIFTFSMSSLLSVCRLYFQYVVSTFSMLSLLSVCRLYFQYVVFTFSISSLLSVCRLTFSMSSLLSVCRRNSMFEGGPGDICMDNSEYLCHYLYNTMKQKYMWPLWITVPNLITVQMYREVICLAFVPPKSVIWNNILCNIVHEAKLWSAFVWSATIWNRISGLCVWDSTVISSSFSAAQHKKRTFYLAFVRLSDHWLKSQWSLFSFLI